MILQELYNFYERKHSEPDADIAPPGFAPQKISFAVVLEPDGTLVDIMDIRETSGKKPVPVSLLVPETQKASVNIAANFLWDNTGYALGFDGKGKPERTKKTFEAFKEFQKEVAGDSDDEGVRAVLAFLSQWDPARAEELEVYEELLDRNLVFRLHGERGYIHERAAAIEAWQRYTERNAEENKVTGFCLVTGEEQPIARLHTNKIKGVKDAQSSGAAVVSFNLDAFTSYGKEQSFNAPTGTHAAFAYTTALNYLLRFESRQKIQIGDATTVFWARKPTKVENFLSAILNPGREQSADSEIREYLEAVRAGIQPEEIDQDVEFFILGLSPNASRIAVRFWYAGTVGQLNNSIGLHVNDTDIVKEFENQFDFPGIWHFLIETAVQRKSDNINPHLSGAFARAVLTGGPYPANLLNALINRIRADHEINYYRCALIKGVLCRNARLYKGNEEEVTKVLNEDSTNTAYRLGRLFAVLEKAQQDAIPGIKATIKDRFYGSASSTPRIVFPQLIRLSQHHINKLERGKLYYEKLSQEIINGIESFPPHLNLHDQGRFALGYYHQRKALFTKRFSEESVEN